MAGRDGQADPALRDRSYVIGHHLFSCLLLMIAERMIDARGSPLSIEIPPAEGS
jgi:hypothetical protein